jgi:predicted transcriptional regulator of viral defense system
MIINDINVIKAKFKNKDSFTTQDLVEELEKYFPNPINENTIKSKIHSLKEKGIIHNVARGLYSLAKTKQQYLPEVSPEARALHKSVQQELPYTALCIIDTKWFNEFMLHQVFKTYLIIEVEKEATATVFNRLTEQDKKSFINPGSEIFEHYINNTENVIIVKSLISESPLIELGDIKAPSLEKLLVDCLCDKEIYGAQYQEANVIFRNAFEKYNVNINKLKRYARRRNKVTEITQLLNKNKQG